MGAIATLISFSPSTKIKSSEVNANFTAIRDAFNATAVLTDVAKTITVSHTISADPGLILTAAVSRIVAGATSFAIRNAANSSDNLLVTDAGVVTARGILKVSGGLAGTDDLEVAGAGTVTIKNAIAGGGLVTVGGGGTGGNATVNVQKGGAGTSRFQVEGTDVVKVRKTGWATWTGTPNRATKDTATATLADVAQTLKALIDDLHGTAGHGLIGT